MPDIHQHLLLELALDLANSLNNSIDNRDRFERLLSTIRKVINCDAVALLGRHDDVLTPLAVQGLSKETLGRRFMIHEHPRLTEICHSRTPIRFPNDCPHPDPFDGLLLGKDGDLPIHACMGLPLYSDNTLLGVVTLDSLEPHAFSGLSEKALQLIAALSAATLKTALELTQLSHSATHAQRVVTELTKEALLKDGGELIGRSQAIKHLRNDIELVASSEYTVLILGETGVGKELVARNLHRLSTRSQQPLVYLNCASLTETLAEAELFGHVKGAFTGAEQARLGKFALADGGTLFLDEVGELPLSVQSKLLRALQSGEIQPVGKDSVDQVNVRIIAATNRDLLNEIDQGHFRADLYHRLSVYPLTVPPLRKREDDVLLLAGFFIEKSCRKLGLRQLKLSESASQALQNYNWPGNVRELEHLISRAGLKAKRNSSPESVTTLTPDLLELPSTLEVPVQISTKTQQQPSMVNLRQATEAFQRSLIQQTLERHQGNWSQAAKQLSTDRANLVRLAKRLGIYITKQVVNNHRKS